MEHERKPGVIVVTLWLGRQTYGVIMKFHIWLVLAVVMVLASQVLTGGVLAENGNTLDPQQAAPDFQGSPQDQAACASDASKFCSDAIPDTFRVLACLQEHRKHLKKDCREVLDAHGQ